jgi:hypothetical protein
LVDALLVPQTKRTIESVLTGESEWLKSKTGIITSDGLKIAAAEPVRLNKEIKDALSLWLSFFSF